MQGLTSPACATDGDIVCVRAGTYVACCNRYIMARLLSWMYLSNLWETTNIVLPHTFAWWQVFTQILKQELHFCSE